MNVKKQVFLLFYFLLFSTYLNADNKKEFKVATIAFYNVENLFDTIVSSGYINGELGQYESGYHTSISADSSIVSDTQPYEGEFSHEKLKDKKVVRPLSGNDEFSPEGKRVWTADKYQKKLENISGVISEIGFKTTQSAPVVVGLSEIENREVVEDLINTPKLKPYNYGIIHYNSFDERGIDCALIYQKDRFTVEDSKTVELKLYDDDERDYTRDILLVSGLLDGERMHFLVNHWPSRSGGEKASMPKRIAAGKLLKTLFDELRQADPSAKIIAMGDFNDDPVNPSIKKVLRPKSKKNSVKEGDLYNPTADMYRRGQGTLAYRGSWNLFDQVILSSGLITPKDYTKYQFYKANIFNKQYLITQEGQYKGYPFRTFSGDTFKNGYSDHFPVYVYLIKEK